MPKSNKFQPIYVADMAHGWFVYILLWLSVINFTDSTLFAIVFESQ